MNLHFFCSSGLTAFIACRLVPLNKNPGVHPIGICETIRRIISKAILKVTRVDILSAVGPLQLCAGQDVGCETAVHTMRSVFNDGDTEGVLLIDVKNAFNSLNRAAALHNIQVLCPSLAPTLINLYRSNTELFVDGESILSQEGTTQGDPFSSDQCSLHSWYNSDLVCRRCHCRGSPDLFARMVGSAHSQRPYFWLLCQQFEVMADSERGTPYHC